MYGDGVLPDPESRPPVAVLTAQCFRPFGFIIASDHHNRRPQYHSPGKVGGSGFGGAGPGIIAVDFTEYINIIIVTSAPVSVRAGDKPPPPPGPKLPFSHLDSA